jgi:two-component system, OmpR family, sensor histidine kinase KdpD
MEENRADSFLRMIRGSKRGRLKVYLGYAAGVGKTYDMLEEAHRMASAGVDVAVGLVETHGREETAALLEGLEIIPRKRHEYKGIVLEEMDTEAIIARRPQVALIDELAHTNVPGGSNAKRYEDVQDILAEGIHVITTLNVQHIESLYNVVEKASSVKVFERIPDSVLAEADEIVNVDLTTEDLNERLKQGKIYPMERVETALNNFFKKTNLEQLRELTLRELASQIDLKSRDIDEDSLSATPDQIMVCLSSKGPNSERLLRYASRLAGRLNRNWYAVYIQTPSEEPGFIDAITQRLLSDTLTLAKQLGALVFTFRGDNIADAIMQFAREYRVGHIIIGSPADISWWKRLRGKQDIAGRLIRDAKDITIIIHDTKRSDSNEPELLENSKSKSLPEFNKSKQDGRINLLSKFMSPEGILIFDEETNMDSLLKRLCETAASLSGMGHKDDVVKAVFEREQQGSTFYNEGAAFPHARIIGLKKTTVALGLTRKGLSDVATDKPVQFVFLILSPLENPDMQIRLLGLTARASKDKRLTQKLFESDSPGNAYDIITDWEYSKSASIDN